MRIKSEDIKKAAKEKGYKIVRGSWGFDTPSGEKCRCPLNCLVDLPNILINHEDVAEALGLNVNYVRGFVRGMDGSMIYDSNYISHHPETMQGLTDGLLAREEIFGV